MSGGRAPDWLMPSARNARRPPFPFEMDEDHRASPGSEEAPHRNERFPIEEIGEHRSGKHDGAGQSDGPVGRKRRGDGGGRQLEDAEHHGSRAFPIIKDVAATEACRMRVSPYRPERISRHARANGAAERHQPAPRRLRFDQQGRHWRECRPQHLGVQQKKQRQDRRDRPVRRDRQRQPKEPLDGLLPGEDQRNGGQGQFALVQRRKQTNQAKVVVCLQESLHKQKLS